VCWSASPPCQSVMVSPIADQRPDSQKYRRDQTPSTEHGLFAVVVLMLALSCVPMIDRMQVAGEWRRFSRVARATVLLVRGVHPRNASSDRLLRVAQAAIRAEHTHGGNSSRDQRSHRRTSLCWGWQRRVQRLG